MPTKDLTRSQFRFLADAVHRHTGVTMEEDKASLLANRVRRRVRALKLDSVNDYIDLLSKATIDAAELIEFIDAVTTHKTSFFRTRTVWDTMLEELNGWRDGRGLRIWSAASSSGQEAYSIAMMLSSMSDAGQTGASWRVVASDVSKKIADRASEGVYDALDVANAAKQAPPQIAVDKWFDQSADDKATVQSELRSRIHFKQHNLLESMPDTFDVVFLRNVIIYFTEDDLTVVLKNVLSTMSPGALLVIGESESLSSRNLNLEYVGPCVYRVSS